MNVRFSVFPRTEQKCFGCRRVLRKSDSSSSIKSGEGAGGDPRFTFYLDDKRKVYVCPLCAMLNVMKDNGNDTIREGEFVPSTMANIHRKHLRELVKRHNGGEQWMDIVGQYFNLGGNKNEKTL